ncbi:MFS transporter [Streptomyces odontomachi]|uniref:MFS transporter n=1 Tax=Streptomyces odontomachi TaxID=2944940 RepID=UPI00210DEF08|nr:MFS transporter [Streptomyces sp. ODS25]
MSETSELRTIRTDVPARLDRLPWSRFHWRVVLGLGTVWVLDGLEVTIVGAVAQRMTEPGSGIHLNAADIGLAAGIYVAGACAGALFFGQLTDRFGRKKLFMLTLGLYILATLATAGSFAPWYFFLMRFFTGAGIGGEYAAINSAIDELIPARNRGRVDLAINGSYWLGAAIGSAASLLLLNASLLASNVGWRLAFGIGGILGLGIILIRRSVPESPRWLFIHGREAEAERIVDGIEREVREETGEDFPRPSWSIRVRQRRAIPFREIAGTAARRYPRRALLGLALFVGQAFMYNAVTFDLGTILGQYFGVNSGHVPQFLIVFAVCNFLGPVLLGRFFDTIGRKPMITASYVGTGLMAIATAVLMMNVTLSAWQFFGLVGFTFFLASAGASSAYLTVSEVFPMESRALCIALFFAIGTAVGGISGPMLFGQLIHSGSINQVAIGFLIGAAVMILGGIAEVLFGVRAEQQSLENIAVPLTAEEAEKDFERGGAPAPSDEVSARVAARSARNLSRERRGVRRFRPGPGRFMYSPGMIGTGDRSSRTAAMADRDLDREVEELAGTLDRRGSTGRDELKEVVHGRSWGPGRFRSALRQTVRESRANRMTKNRYRPPGRDRER